MKIYKKLISFLLIACMLLTCTTACDNSGNKEEKDMTTENFVKTFAKRTPPVIEKAAEVTPTAEDFTVSNVFSNNMVLQRDEYIRIWGTADAEQKGKTICAEFMGLKGSAEIDENGDWLITLDGTLPACTEKGNSLRVYSSTKEKVFNDVLVGDVYMVLGQSNAAQTVQDVLNGYKNAPNYTPPFSADDINNDDNIRIISNNPKHGNALKQDGSTFMETKVYNKSGWRAPASNNYAKNCSAIGYFFAKQLTNATKNEIPVGIIDVSLAATVLAAFMTPDVAEKLGVDNFNKGQNAYMADSILGLQRSRIMYNQYLHPFMNCSISGIIWYQGESDAKEPLQSSYVTNFITLMEAYRKEINQNFRDYPIFIMEFPACFANAATYGYIDFGGVRANMGTIPSQLPNSHFIVTSDLWKDSSYADAAHTYCKWEMATRVLGTVLPLFYGEYASSAVDTTAGPVYVSKKVISDTEAELSFAYAGEGLKTADDSYCKGFEVRTSSGWLPASEVTLDGSKVTVSHTEAFNAIRYHATTQETFPENINVCNSAGIPMAAFTVYLNK